MKHFLSLFLVSSFFLLSGSILAKEKKGADILIRKTDETQVKGELIAVKQRSLLLLERESGADVAVDIEDIAIIRLTKKSKALLGAAVGFIAGAIAGSIWWMSVQEADDTSITNPYALAAGAGGGAAIGALIGAQAGSDKTIQIEGQSDSEMGKIMGELRKNARIREYR
jgi:hypothetical protein